MGLIVKGDALVRFVPEGENEIRIPDGILVIEREAFAHSRNIKKITIPGSVETIGDRAFLGCSGIKVMVLSGCPLQIGEDAFRLDSASYWFELGELFIRQWDPVLTRAFSGCQIRLLHIDLLSTLPSGRRFEAICGFLAETHPDTPGKREKEHLRYIRRKSADTDYLDLIVRDPEIWHYLLKNRAIAPEAIPLLESHARENRDIEQIAELLRYRDLIRREIKMQAENREKRQERYFDTLIQRAGKRIEENGIAGMSFAIDGVLLITGWKPNTYFGRYLAEYGAKLHDVVTGKTDYLVLGTNHPDFSEKQRKAASFGVPVLTEAEFLILIGKRFEDKERIVVPRWLKTIEEGSLSGCAMLKEILLHDGICRIGPTAFDRCRQLEHIEIPDSVKEIGNAAFRGCESLKTAKLPRRLTVIEMRTFEDCISLQSADLPFDRRRRVPQLPVYGRDHYSRPLRPHPPIRVQWMRSPSGNIHPERKGPAESVSRFGKTASGERITGPEHRSCKHDSTSGGNDL